MVTRWDRAYARGGGWADSTSSSNSTSNSGAGGREREDGEGQGTGERDEKEVGVGRMDGGGTCCRGASFFRGWRGFLLDLGLVMCVFVRVCPVRVVVACVEGGEVVDVRGGEVVRW
jgi:hypothetical protein